MQSCLEVLKTCDWEYVAEGAYNVVLKYVGDSDQLDSSCLRCRKVEVVNFKAEDNKEGKITETFESALNYIRKKMLPLLGEQYVRPGSIVNVSKEFLYDLDKQIWLNRPKKRRDKGQHLDVDQSTALLLPNSMVLPTSPKNCPESTKENSSPTFCVELKPKCGFLPTCAAVTHQVKKEYSRFHMHQRLKAAQAVSKGQEWTISDYDPVKLFSGNKSLMKEAVEALVQAPQNNFRVFANQRLIFGEGVSGSGKEELSRILEENLCTESADVFLDVVVDILFREPLLKRLLSAQSLDEMDIETVYPVYKQLMDTDPEVIQQLTHYSLKGNTLFPRSSSQCDLLDNENQIELLERFMVATTAKDCSVMLALQKTSEEVQAQLHDSVVHFPDVADDHTQTTLSDFSGWKYAITAVDLDPKPLAKIPYYFELDREIAVHFENSLAETK